MGTKDGSDARSDELRATVLPRACPRYDKCSAPICPLDAEWEARRHIKGEAVCNVLLELAKPNGLDTVKALLPAQAPELAAQRAQPILEAHGSIRRACDKAQHTGSRTRMFGAMRQARAVVSKTVSALGVEAIREADPRQPAMCQGGHE